MKIYLTLLLLILGFAACKQDAKPTDGETSQTEPSNTTAASGSKQFQLRCEAMTANGDVPKNAIFAIANERKTKIMEITSLCMEVKPANYKDYGIPSDAISVVGGWFAGIGDYFYAKQEGKQINVYYSAIGEEGPPAGVHSYYKIASYENGKLNVYPLE